MIEAELLSKLEVMPLAKGPDLLLVVGLAGVDDGDPVRAVVVRGEAGRARHVLDVEVLGVRKLLVPFHPVAAPELERAVLLAVAAVEAPRCEVGLDPQLGHSLPEVELLRLRVHLRVLTARDELYAPPPPKHTAHVCSTARDSSDRHRVAGTVGQCPVAGGHKRPAMRSAISPPLTPPPVGGWGGVGWGWG